MTVTPLGIHPTRFTLNFGSHVGLNCLQDRVTLGSHGKFFRAFCGIRVMLIILTCGKHLKVMYIYEGGSGHATGHQVRGHAL